MESGKYYYLLSTVNIVGLVYCVLSWKFIITLCTTKPRMVEKHKQDVKKVEKLPRKPTLLCCRHNSQKICSLPAPDLTFYLIYCPRRKRERENTHSSFVAPFLPIPRKNEPRANFKCCYLNNKSKNCFITQPEKDKYRHHFPLS